MRTVSSRWLCLALAADRSLLSGRAGSPKYSMWSSSVAARVNMFLNDAFDATATTAMTVTRIAESTFSSAREPRTMCIYHRPIPSRPSLREATPPQRLRDFIHWTPQCSSRNSPTNQTPHAAPQAITPSRPFLASDHLQTADQSTYPLPIPLHITMSPAVTLCISPGSFQSGSGQSNCAFAALDRHYTLDKSEKIDPSPISCLFTYIFP
jgi:hypothetical protein